MANHQNFGIASQSVQSGIKKKRVGWGGNDTRQMGSEEQSEDACILISGDPDFVLTENDRSKGCDSDADIMLF